MFMYYETTFWKYTEINLQMQYNPILLVMTVLYLKLYTPLPVQQKCIK